MTPQKTKYICLFIFFIFLSSPLFFYKLGQSSLVSWDEAWYGAIAKNILNTGDIFNLSFNGSRFADHPPAGFWLMAVSMKLLGISDFSVRFASAISGLISLVLIFILGWQLSSPGVGLASGIALLSSPWFISRARSGNLDIPLTMFFLLTFVLSFKAAKNSKFLLPFGLSLGLLFLTKTMVPFTIIPALIIIMWGTKLNIKHLFPALIAFLLPPTAWVISQLINYPHFIDKYFGIGLPQGQIKTSLFQNISQVKSYLHSGIGTWFRPTVIGLPFALFFIKNRKLMAVFVFILSFMLPFAFSSRGQIWHLIPVFPFLIVLFFSIIFNILKSYFLPLTTRTSSLLIVFSLLISSPQLSRNWREFIDIPAYISDEAILSEASAALPYPLTIDDRFLPAAVYYSNKSVNYPETNSLVPLFSQTEPLLLITHTWRLDQLPDLKPRYQILKQDRDMVLILITTAP